MVYDDIKVSRETRRVPEDDQVTLGSLDYDTRSAMSDEWTLPGDDDVDARSFSDASSMMSYDSYDSYIHPSPLPSYRVPKEQGVKQPVYEAWVVYCAADNKEVVSGIKVCGVNMFEHYDQLYGHINTRPIVRAQSELTGMHLAAIERYQAANKRSLPSRLVRGRAKSYERDLEERVRKLPAPVQSEINSLLADREQSTSNRYHVRDWTVVLMREEMRYRFTSTESDEVKRHKLRFWKNKDKKQPVEYFVVVRGEEVNFPENDKGHFTQRRYGNPWSRVDQQERRARDRARDAKALEFDKLGGRRTRSRRRLSPPPLYRRARPRSITPPPPRNIPTPGPPPPPGMAIPPYGMGRAPRPFVYNPVPPPPAPPLPRYPSYPPAPPMPYQGPPGFGPVYPAGPPAPPPPSAGFPIRSPYSQNLSYPPVWHSPPQPAPIPFVSVCGNRSSYPPTMMHPAPPFPGSRPDFIPPPPPPPVMPLSPPSSSFPAPPPPPMPSNLTTPTFTATASERSVPQQQGGINAAGCTCNHPPTYRCDRGGIWKLPCAACKASQNVARSDADVSELAVEDEKEVGKKEKKKQQQQEKGTDSGLGDDEDDEDRDDQLLYD